MSFCTASTPSAASRCATGWIWNYICAVKTGKHLYVCPEENHILDGQMLPCEGKADVDPDEDSCLFGGWIRRGLHEWNGGYKGHYGAERLFAWWKLGCPLEGHHFRGKANITLRTLLTTLAYQARQIAQLGVVVGDKAD